MWLGGGKTKGGKGVELGVCLDMSFCAKDEKRDVFLPLACSSHIPFGLGDMYGVYMEKLY